ncbi:MAG: hypothetical protein IPL21_02625 [Saprospirales bacterium]|nr:hypothetical protein [Saprospirales bacterium]
MKRSESESVENKILLEEVIEVKQPIVEEVLSKEIADPIIEETKEIVSEISEETIPEIVEETVVEKPIVEEKLSAAEIVLQRIQQIKLERENPKTENENKSESENESESVENKILSEEVIEVKQPIVEEVVSKEIADPIIEETKEIVSEIPEETIPEIVEETVIEKPIVEEKLSAAEIVLQRIQQIKLERENPKIESENKSESVENKILLEEVIEVKQPIVEEVVSKEITQPIIEETKEIVSEISEETIPEIVEEKPIVEEIEEKINEKITTTEILAVEKTEETSNVIQEKTDLQKSLVVQIIPEFTNIHDEIENNFVTISIEKEITPKTEYKEKEKEKEIEVENSTTQIQTTDANIETAVEFKDEIKHEISEAVVEKPIIENKIIEEIIEPIIEQKTQQPETIEKTVEPNIQNTSEPHTFVEWLKLLDGKLQIQTAPNNQTDNWMEIPRYEVEQSLQNKKTEKSLDELDAEIKQSNQKEEKITIQPVFEEGEIDLFNEIDVEVTKSATESVSFKNDMMTETLANIYVKQGKIEKALDIYNTLRLKFPEKSAYFASLIQNLTKSE